MLQAPPITKFAVPILEQIPFAFQTNGSKQQNKGRPADKDRQEAFLAVSKYLEENDDEQVTVKDLVDKLGECCEQQPYSVRFMKEKLKEHFGDNIVITCINGKADVVTINSTASTILRSFYEDSKGSDSAEADKIRVIKAAAGLIKNDIKCKDTSKSIWTKFHL